MNRDPIGYKAGVNLGEYVSGAPSNRHDPGGLDWVWPWDPNAEWWLGFPNILKPGNPQVGDVKLCGLLTAKCLCQSVSIPVYANSAKAHDILDLGGIAEGCVTFPDGIYCTNPSCSAIKTVMSGDNPSKTLLSHEACHFCVLKDDGFAEYLRSAGHAPDPCVGHERQVEADW